MRIKRVVIQGFKTFATKTEFVFDPGITAVVGPNGSGKSNIVDAIRWCLGEQSFSLLRSKKTADVIFSGSDKKARLGMAEVFQKLRLMAQEEGKVPVAVRSNYQTFAETGMLGTPRQTVRDKLGLSPLPEDGSAELRTILEEPRGRE